MARSSERDRSLKPISGNFGLSAGRRLLLSLSIGFAIVPAGVLAFQAFAGQIRPVIAAANGGSAAQEVHTVFLVSDQNGTGSDAVRNRVAERLSKSRDLRVATSEASADAVLKIDAVIWPSSSAVLNPRSPNVTVATVQGYASAELLDRSQQPLWSYLATPGRFHLRSIVDDLGDQLTANLLAAAGKGLRSTPNTVASPGKTSRGLRIAGATFPAPLYRKWFESFAQGPDGFAIDYAAIGSQAGVDELRSGRIDIASSDIATALGPDSPLALGHLYPTVVGGVVPVYNLPGLERTTVNFTADVLAEIFSGRLVRWNDARLRAINRGVRLPDRPILVIHRQDGSGTTYIWTRYLAETSHEWDARQVGANIHWAVGTGIEKSEGVVLKVASTPFSIGYVELTYAIRRRTNFGAVLNRSGRYIKADLPSLSAAAALPANAGIPPSILNSPQPDAYPIATFTWFLIPDSLDVAKRKAASALLNWVLTSGQRQCSSLAYAPLPKEVVQKELREVAALQ